MHTGLDRITSHASIVPVSTREPGLDRITSHASVVPVSTRSRDPIALLPEQVRCATCAAPLVVNGAAGRPWQDCCCDGEGQHRNGRRYHQEETSLIGRARLG